MKTRVNLKYFVTDCLWKHFFILTRPTSLQTFFFENLGNSKAFHIVLT